MNCRPSSASCSVWSARPASAPWLNSVVPLLACRCQCNGHADTCIEQDGTGCPCQNNTETVQCPSSSSSDRKDCYRQQVRIEKNKSFKSMQTNAWVETCYFLLFKDILTQNNCYLESIEPILTVHITGDLTLAPLIASPPKTKKSIFKSAFISRFYLLLATADSHKNSTCQYHMMP